MMENESVPQISVIIPFYKGIGDLGRCLEGLDADILKNHTEIIVIDDHGPEESKKVAKLVDNLGGRYFRQTENRGPGIARNRGAALAKGRILTFIDSDCIPTADWLSKLLRPILEETVFATTSCYSGPVYPDRLAVFQDEDYRYRMPMVECNVNFVNSCNFAVERDAFFRCGGFPRQRVSEDMVLGMLLADQRTPARFLPNAGVKHAYHQSVHKYLGQRFAFAANTIRSFLSADRTSTEGTTPPVRSYNPLRTFWGMLFASAVVVMISLAIAAATKPYSNVFLTLSLFAFMLEMVGHGKFLHYLAGRQGTMKALSFVPLLVAIDISYSAGVFWGVVTGSVDRIRRVVQRSSDLDLVSSQESLDSKDH